MKPLAANIWDRESLEHYVEPEWCSRRLFDEVRFDGKIWDPACGFGRVCESAVAAGHPVWNVLGTDIENRGYENFDGPNNFLELQNPWDNIVSNPPFDCFPEFAQHALTLARRKVALLWLVRRLNAARWLAETPLASILLLTPRPSMPPGHVVTELAKAGKEPSGGTQDFCWLVWNHTHRGPPTIGWLRRDVSHEKADRKAEVAA